jgi:predicted deacylase
MHTAERLTLARLPSGVPLVTTVHRYHGPGGPDAGPTLYVQAAQHGREINGTEVLRRLHDRLRDADLSGTVVTVPVADPLTFDRKSYTTPEVLDSVNANMNRVWPGDPEGSLHQRMAATLWEYAAEADAVVDLHTGSPDMLTHTVYQRDDAQCRELAEAFGTDLLLAEAAGEDADPEWADRDFGGKFRVAAREAGIPAITPELAHSKQLVEPAVETGVQGLENVLRHLGIREGDPETPDEYQRARNHLGRATADASGLFRPDPDLELGAEVTAGERLGVVTDPTTFETLATVRAEESGVVYSVTREATVCAGDTLVGVALPLE